MPHEGPSQKVTPELESRLADDDHKLVDVIVPARATIPYLNEPWYC